jgi:hypothetical protein
MSQFLLKTFNKSKVVKVIIFYNDRRVKTRYAVPINNTVTVGDLTLVINNKDYYLSNGYPTYVYEENDANTKNMYANQKSTTFSPVELNTIINNNVAQQIFDASGKGFDKSTFAIIISFATLALVAYIAYAVFDMNTQLSTQIAEIREVLRVIGGR